MLKKIGKAKYFPLIIGIVVFVVAVMLGLALLSPYDNENKSDKTVLQKDTKIKNEPSAVDSTKLQALIEEWIESQNTTFAVKVQEIDGLKRSASVNSAKQMIPASTYKLFLSYVILLEVEEGNFELADKVPGTEVSIEECIESLLVISSDECAWQLGNMVGWDEVDKTLADKGFTSTKLNNYSKEGQFIGDKKSSVDDEVELLVRLQSGTLLNGELSNLMLGFMRNQVHRERIPAGISDNIVVADKPGWLDGIENDTAIVYAPTGPYVLTIFSAEASTSQLAELSKLIYTNMIL